jgi:acyl-CoA reductase-like NAD-dependent aldehyde dehydrogenase
VIDVEALTKRVVTVGPRDEIEVEQPFTGGRLGATPACTPEDVAAAIERAREAQRAWARTGFAERRAVLLRYHDLVLDRQDEIFDVLQVESGKARRHAFEEVLDGAIVARYYANTAEDFLRARRRQGAFPVLTSTWEYHHPLGVIGIIAPWNYPLTLSISDAVPALAAGNGVVVKPDRQTPFSTLWGAALLEEAGLPPGLLQVVTGAGSELGTPLIDGVDYMMFTGSTATGRRVAEQAGHNLIGASMELGGKNAMIVLGDANIGRAVEGAERALFSNAGQLCISIERLYVHESVADEYTRALVDRIRGMKLAAGLDFGADMGSLISRDQLDTVEAHVNDAVQKGAQVLAGGHARPDIGPYFLRAHAPGQRAGRHDAVPQRDLRPRGRGVAFRRRGRSGAARQRQRVRPQLQRLDPRHAPRPRARHAATSGHGERQRGLRAGMGLGGRPDGGHEGLGPRPPPRGGRHRQVHRGPDRRGPAAASDRAPAARRPAPVGPLDDRRPARLTAAAGYPVGAPLSPRA